jgi:hypothetical protein
VPALIEALGLELFEVRRLPASGVRRHQPRRVICAGR